MPGAHGQRARSPQTACQEPTDSVPGAPHAASSQLAARQHPTLSVPGSHSQRARIPQAARQRSRSPQPACQYLTCSAPGVHRQPTRSPQAARQEPTDSAPGARRQRARSPQTACQEPPGHACSEIRCDPTQPNAIRSDVSISLGGFLHAPWVLPFLLPPL